MKMNELPLENEIVLCIVDRILGTTVFVKLLKYSKEGVISTSEVAPGRIRNIRDYVMAGKRIVCKVLRADEKTGNIDLSLRRVSKKEREDAVEADKKERDAFAMLKMISGEKAEGIAEKIRLEHAKLSEFIRDINSIDTEKFGLSNESKKQIEKIISEKPKKIVSAKAKIKLQSEESNGIIMIKEIFSEIMKSYKNVKISYISATNYSISVSSEDYKEANKKLSEILKKIEELAEEKHCEAEFLD
ncbi:MAG: S1 RNA-binding domain-containing protein [archaeon]